jgi:hypothetical protein
MSTALLKGNLSLPMIYSVLPFKMATELILVKSRNFMVVLQLPD